MEAGYCNPKKTDICEGICNNEEPIRKKFCSHDKDIEQAYDDLLNSSKKTLGSMMELQEASLESDEAAKGADEIPSASNGENDEWPEVQRLQTRIGT